MHKVYDPNFEINEPIFHFYEPSFTMNEPISPFNEPIVKTEWLANLEMVRFYGE